MHQTPSCYSLLTCQQPEFRLGCPNPPPPTNKPSIHPEVARKTFFSPLRWGYLLMRVWGGETACLKLSHCPAIALLVMVRTSVKKTEAQSRLSVWSHYPWIPLKGQSSSSVSEGTPTLGPIGPWSPGEPGSPCNKKNMVLAKPIPSLAQTPGTIVLC